VGELQTGSGKTYTMGTGYKVGGSSEGVIPKVMETIFRKVETLKAKSDFQLRVSFIEVSRHWLRHLELLSSRQVFFRRGSLHQVFPTECASSADLFVHEKSSQSENPCITDIERGSA
jgi:hypothetical protein